MEGCNSKMLNRAMRNAGIKNGFEDIDTEFMEFRDFRLKWIRLYKWVSFKVSVYLKNAQKNVIESLAKIIIAKIQREDRTEYSQEACDNLNSD